MQPNEQPSPAPVMTESKPDQVTSATQETYEFDGHKMPGLATDAKGGITLPSMIDVFFHCLAAMNDPKVNEVLKANKLTIKDLDGNQVFPKTDDSH